MKETRKTDRTVVEHTGPAWRLVGVILFFAGIFCLGWAVQEAGLADPFATVSVITVFVAIAGWAREKPGRLRKRLGAYGKIAVAVVESADEIRASFHARPLPVLIVLGAVYGLVVVLAQYAVVAVLTALASWQIAVGAGALVGALVAAPGFFGSVYHALSVPDDDEDLEEPEDEDLEDEDELSRRRRRAAGEE